VPRIRLLQIEDLSAWRTKKAQWELRFFQNDRWQTKQTLQEAPFAKED
jgi:hypothetical protein